MPYNRDELFFEATAMRGAASLKQMLDCIGGGSDRVPAQVLVDNEMQLRALLTFALHAFAKEV